ncbi:MAG TPA: nitroreductase family deazaflavin-dependent oxidoreductase, partial [Gaiellaceae bacterium]|jgi:deazaflavin-dependent oxidoreductase (nitroreductase family)|nr:nitroreductase family deazaflavin-dependent oxidoreductase [Gaiellaceae bacterium]
MSEATDPNEQVIDQFRAGGGKVGGPFEGFPLVLVHHTGAKSGIERVNPLVYQRLGDDSIAIFASKGGALTNPDWYHNLVANPNASIEIGTEQYDVTARVATDDERRRIWDAQKAAFPNFAEYEATSGGREIPVVVLDKVT